MADLALDEYINFIKPISVEINEAYKDEME